MMKVDAFRIEPEVLEGVALIAEREYRTRAQVVRMAIRDYVERVLGPDLFAGHGAGR